MTEPRVIAAEALPGDWVVGWKLPAGERARLLERIAPLHPHVIADHVTLRPRVAADTALPDALPAAVVGQASDGEGVQALVVAIGGSTERPDGGTYHITWSLAEDRRPRESNDVLAAQGWTALRDAIAIDLTPALFR